MVLGLAAAIAASLAMNNFMNKLEEKPMINEGKKVVPQTNPAQAELGRGTPGNQIGVQTAQTTAVNPADAKIPSGADVEENIQEIKAVDKQEEGSGMTTTDGYVIDESGRLDNYAVEPEMYVEPQK